MAELIESKRRKKKVRRKFPNRPVMEVRERRGQCPYCAQHLGDGPYRYRTHYGEVRALHGDCLPVA